MSLVPVDGAQSRIEPDVGRLVCGGRDLTRVPAGTRVAVTLRLGKSRAVLSGRAGSSRGADGLPRLMDGRVTTYRSDGKTLVQRVPPSGPPHVGVGAGDLLEDVSGDATSPGVFCLARLSRVTDEPVAVIVTRSAVASSGCCSQTMVFGTGSRGPMVRENGGVPAVIENLSGSAVIGTADDRSRFLFACDACSGTAIRLLQIDAAGFVDVTRAHPKEVATDAAYWFRRVERNWHNGLGYLLAWTSDEYLLGHGGSAWQHLNRWNRQGKLFGVPGWPQDGWYLDELHRYLVRYGYVAASRR